MWDYWSWGWVSFLTYILPPLIFSFCNILQEKEKQEPRGAWEEVGIDDTRVEISDTLTAPILEEEPDASKGVANALKLAIKKGYLEKNNLTKSANAALQHLRAIHYRLVWTLRLDNGSYIYQFLYILFFFFPVM